MASCLYHAWALITEFPQPAEVDPKIYEKAIKQLASKMRSRRFASVRRKHDPNPTPEQRVKPLMRELCDAAAHGISHEAVYELMDKMGLLERMSSAERSQRLNLVARERPWLSIKYKSKSAIGPNMIRQRRDKAVEAVAEATAAAAAPLDEALKFTAPKAPERCSVDLLVQAASLINMMGPP